MDNVSVEFVERLPAEIDQKVERGHRSYETSCGIVCNYTKFWILARNDLGETVGVLAAYTAFAEIYVDDIWVDASHRRKGYGRRLLAALENRYKDQGYNNINLVTSQFQAVGFYEKCGFEIEFIRVNKYEPKLTKTFFVKYFDTESQTQGRLNPDLRE